VTLGQCVLGRARYESRPSSTLIEFMPSLEQKSPKLSFSSMKSDDLKVEIILLLAY
jgi:hypothetical protein